MSRRYLDHSPLQLFLSNNLHPPPLGLLTYNTDFKKWKEEVLAIFQKEGLADDRELLAIYIRWYIASDVMIMIIRLAEFNPVVESILKSRDGYEVFDSFESFISEIAD